MAKRIPPACTPANCGEYFSRCGSISLYTHGKCRCETCTAAVSANRKKHYAENGEATRKRNKQYRADHIETVNERDRRYHAEHRETLLQQMKLRYANNSDAYVDRVRQWRLANPDRYREQTRQKNHLRRARINATKVVDFTPEQLEQKMAYYGNSCYLQIPGICTGAFDHVDHVKPLSKGGPHMIANTRPACKPCNQRKSDKWPLEDAA